MATSNSDSQLPLWLERALDGTNLGEGETPSAMVLASHREGGAVHVALLSRGEIVAVSRQRLLLALHAHTTSAENLRERGEATLLSADASGAVTVSLAICDSRDVIIAGQTLSAFDAKVIEAREHAVPYASLRSGITFELADPEATLTRWGDTVAALRKEYLGS
jgi:hypothetical protein